MFKKSLSIVLAVIMTLSCMSAMLFTASAETTPEGTGITSLSQITDMNGKYYLTGNIGSADALSATTVSDTFAGTLDGNGKTIYTSVPLFEELGEGATIKNLTINGEITKTFTADGAIGSVAEQTAQDANGGVITLENVTSNVNITFSVSRGTSKATTAIGGFIGDLQCVINAKNCVNNGALTMTGQTAANSSAIYFGGMIGRVQNITSSDRSQYVGCVNNGDITCDFRFEDRWILVGGMLGYNKEAVSFVGCTNNGDIAVDDHGQGTTEEQAGKVAGMLAYNNVTSACEYINCKNTGDLSGARIIGGISALDKAPGIVKGCVNEGNITVVDAGDSKKNYAVAGGMIASPASSSIIFEDCVNAGNVITNSTHGSDWLGGIVGIISTDVTKGSFSFVRCGNTGEVSVGEKAGWGGKLGGIFGLQSSTADIKLSFVGCYNDGTVKGSGQVGGIAGQISAACKFVGCVNTGTVTETKGVVNGNFGGIVGNTSNADAKIYNCANKGTLTFTCAAGVVSGIVAAANDAAQIQHCENFGTVERNGSPLHAISSKGTQTNCYDRTGDNAVDATVSLDFEGVQRSIPVEGETTFNLRFITKITDIEKYTSTGVMVYLTESGKNGIKHYTETTDTVFTQISGSENGVNKLYPEVAEEGVYYSALTVTGISTAASYRFTVVPYTVDLDGEYLYDEAYVVTVSDGAIASVEAVATARN